ncbi:hypothetical protein FNJ62_04760 [Streptomyces benahoarensis]|nr:hypothetical protein FNJ62_04760 [Streptomyces benahoarensis]
MFAIGTDSFVIAGILPDAAHSLGVAFTAPGRTGGKGMVRRAPARSRRCGVPRTWPRGGGRGVRRHPPTRAARRPRGTASATTGQVARCPQLALGKGLVCQ